MAEYISLAHGNGGRLMRELITQTIARCLDGVLMDINSDATLLPALDPEQSLVMTTDAFTVKPLLFPGGDIGSLAIHGTVNDLAVCAATPLYLSLNLIIEEGLEYSTLRAILSSMRKAALEAHIKLACGDTKVVPRGEGSGLFIATTGIGQKRPQPSLSIHHIQPGDAILVSGPVGDHAIAVMLVREQFGLRGDVRSDAANVLPLTQGILSLPGLRFMRDPTRGGLATVLNEIHQLSGHGMRVRAASIPIREPVQSVCDILGYDPLYLACEGRVVAVIDAQQAKAALGCWQALPQGKQAAIIGQVSGDRYVILETELGGERILEELEDDPLPRIC